MSQNENFIDEVFDDLRRDRLFALFRRWAWLALLLVLLVVGLAAWYEWRKARETAEARALGDAIVAALALPDPAARAEALALIEGDADARALIGLLAAGATAAADDNAVATVALGAEASRTDSDPRWSHLAALKLVLLESGTLPPEERIARLEPLTASGAPYRLLALEQTALARVELGETDQALAILRDVVADGAVSEGLRLRASQMIVALGGSAEPA
jgi:hypothetical protein